MPPHWFTQALSHQPVHHSTQVLGKSIHYQTWQDETHNQTNPEQIGLLFVHGHAAHAHWWDFIAPAFSDIYRTAALDMSGNGDSEHRDEYKASQFALEIAKVAEQLSSKTIVVAHSFGGSMARIAAHLHPDKLAALVLIDSVISTNKRDMPTPEQIKPPRIRYYDSITQGAKRFRLRPPQPKPSDFILSHIAQHSLKESDQGFCFKLDSQVFDKMWPEETTFPDGASMVQALTMPCAYIYGEHSRFCPPEAMALLRRLFSEDNLVEIKDAYHHLFLDQPEAFIFELDELLKRLVKAF